MQTLFIKELRSRSLQLFLGMIAVYIVSSMVVASIYNYATTHQLVSNQFTIDKLLSNSVQTTPQVLSAQDNKSNTYTVQKGDNLWSIAQSVLGDGFKFKDIAQLNNITNPSIISEGMILNLPKKVTGDILAEAAFTDVPSYVTNTAIKTYSVQEGDNLWSIAADKLGNGDLWPLIAKENNLANPRIISAGDKLTIPPTIASP